MNGRKLLVRLLAASLCTAPAFAHHSIGMVDIAAPVWVQAAVVRFEPRNPHVLIHVTEVRADGQVRPLLIEGPIMARFARMRLPEDFIKPGDIIGICGFPFRKPAAELPALHAQVLVLPDGRMQPWGPYGKLDNCVRAGDSVQSWAQFVNAEPMAHEYWCNALAHATVPSVAPQGFVAAMSSQMTSPCN